MWPPKLQVQPTCLPPERGAPCRRMGGAVHPPAIIVHSPLCSQGKNASRRLPTVCLSPLPCGAAAQPLFSSSGTPQGAGRPRLAIGLHGSRTRHTEPVGPSGVLALQGRDRADGYQRAGTHREVGLTLGRDSAAPRPALCGQLGLEP